MGALSSLATVGLNLALAQQAAQRQSRDIRAERNRQIAAIRARDEEQRRGAEEALRRRLAAQRARAGAAGVSRGGSANAVLRGLIEESQLTTQARTAAVNRQIADIRNRAGRTRRANLLELAGGAGRSALTLFGRNSGSLTSLLGR